MRCADLFSWCWYICGCNCILLHSIPADSAISYVVAVWSLFVTNADACAVFVIVPCVENLPVCDGIAKFWCVRYSRAVVAVLRRYVWRVARTSGIDVDVRHFAVMTRGAYDAVFGDIICSATCLLAFIAAMRRNRAIIAWLAWRDATSSPCYYVCDKSTIWYDMTMMMHLICLLVLHSWWRTRWSFITLAAFDARFVVVVTIKHCCCDVWRVASLMSDSLAIWASTLLPDPGDRRDGVGVLCCDLTRSCQLLLFSFSGSGTFLFGVVVLLHSHPWYRSPLCCYALVVGACCDIDRLRDVMMSVVRYRASCVLGILKTGNDLILAFVIYCGEYWHRSALYVMMEGIWCYPVLYDVVVGLWYIMPVVTLLMPCSVVVCDHLLSMVEESGDGGDMEQGVGGDILQSSQFLMNLLPLCSVIDDTISCIYSSFCIPSLCMLLHWHCCGKYLTHLYVGVKSYIVFIPLHCNLWWRWAVDVWLHSRYDVMIVSLYCCCCCWRYDVVVLYIVGCILLILISLPMSIHGIYRRRLLIVSP